MGVSETLSELRGAGYVLSVEGGRLKVAGAERPPERLRQSIAENKHAFMARVLLENLPPWLVRMLNLYAHEIETPVRRTGPGGRIESHAVKVAAKNIAASVSLEAGLDVASWQKVIPEVEEFARSWEAGEIVPLVVAGNGP